MTNAHEYFSPGVIKPTTDVKHLGPPSSRVPDAFKIVFFAEAMKKAVAVNGPLESSGENIQCIVRVAKIRDVVVRLR